MNYQEQLKTKEWKDKREAILKRDDYKCTECGLKRPVLLGINRKIGIIDHQEFSKSGQLFLDLKNNKAHLMFYYGLPLYYESFVLGDITNAKIEDLRFAEQKKEDIMRLLCFTDNISNEDLRPDLHVHHKFYIHGNRAWEYEDDALVTLCIDCHQKEHDEKVIKVYSKNKEELYIIEKCGKCYGSGYLKEYDYYCDGICFDCHGEGISRVNSV